MFVALIVAQGLRLEVEPFGAESHQLLLRGLGCRRGGRIRQADRCAAPQHRPDPGHQFAQFAGLCDVVVGPELQPDHPVDRAGRRGQHDYRDIGAALEVADDRQAIFLGHVEVEHHQVRHAGFDGAAQALAAVAERDGEAVHFEIVANHLAGGRFVVDNDDMRVLAHVRIPPRRAA